MSANILKVFTKALDLNYYKYSPVCDRGSVIQFKCEIFSLINHFSIVECSNEWPFTMGGIWVGIQNYVGVFDIVLTFGSYEN